MTRLYYTDSFLYEFDAEVLDVVPADDHRSAIILDQTAFYPTSGGQTFDTGSLTPKSSPQKLSVVEVSEREDGTVLHVVDGIPSLARGTTVHGAIDAARRRDHMQQHSGQHVLSAAFIRLFNLPTVSFHMADDYCSIDLDTSQLSTAQVEASERLANEVILEDREVAIRFVTQHEARTLGLRKLPPLERGQLRLIDIRDFDLTACGGTHVRHTGQIGCILVRKTEKTRQGIRVEFVCGQRAVRTARRDYTTLSEAAGLYSAHLWDLPQQVRRSQQESRTLRKNSEQLLEELAEQHAMRMLAETPLTNSRKLLVQVLADRDLAYIKLLAQKLTRLQPNVVALLGTTSPPPALVFAQSPGQPFDMGALIKQALAKLGGRGGGSKDMAQGGPQDSARIPDVINELLSTL